MGNKKNSPILIVLIGLPASGKSTLANQLQTDFSPIYSPLQIIDTDTIRGALFGADFNPDNEERVIAEKFKQIKSALDTNEMVIVDDMHYYVSMRHDLRDVAKESGALYFSIYLTTPVVTCQAWNSKRESSVTADLISEIEDKFNYPGDKYAWDRPKFVFNPVETAIKSAVMICSVLLKTEVEEFRISKEKESDPKETASSTSSNIATNQKKHKDDLVARKLMHFLIKKELPSPLLDSIDQELSNLTFPIDLPQKRSESLNQLRKPYMEWITEHGKDVSPESFHQFLVSFKKKEDG